MHRRVTAVEGSSTTLPGFAAVLVLTTRNLFSIALPLTRKNLYTLPGLP